MKEPNFNKDQGGIALLAALLIIVIFTIMGMMSAKQAKESEKIAGGNTRYESVFQAAELSLRDAVGYMNAVNGTLIVGYAGDSSSGRKAAKNFNVTGVTTNETNILYDPENTIVWDRKELQRAICGSSGCTTGINFMNRLDEDIWKTHGIQSSFTSNSDEQNYARNIETYTFIQHLNSVNRGAPGGGGMGQGSTFSSQGTSSAKEIFYLVTVKASGFPPGIGAKSRTPLDARENVVLQAVFAKRI